MKTFILLLTLFVFGAVAHTSDSTSEESSSSEEIIHTRHRKPIARVVSDSEESSSSEEVIHTRSHYEDSESSSSEEIIYTRKAVHQSGKKHPKHSKKSSYQRADHDTRWEKFKIQYKVKFTSHAKEDKAKERFVKNRLKVWNHKDNNQNSSIACELNEFATLSTKEFKRTKMGLTP